VLYSKPWHKPDTSIAESEVPDASTLFSEQRQQTA
jgi:hypothetical protein